MTGLGFSHEADAADEPVESDKMLLSVSLLSRPITASTSEGRLTDAVPQHRTVIRRSENHGSGDLLTPGAIKS